MGRAIRPSTTALIIIATVESMVPSWVMKNTIRFTAAEAIVANMPTRNNTKNL